MSTDATKVTVSPQAVAEAGLIMREVHEHATRLLEKALLIQIERRLQAEKALADRSSEPPEVMENNHG